MAEAKQDWLEVLAAMAAGDQVALVKITNVITGLLARLRAYEQRDSWEDLIQEVLVALLRSHQRGAIRDGRAFISYTATITRNELLNHLQRGKKPGSADKIGDPTVAETRMDPLEYPETREAEVLVDMQSALGELPEKVRAVIELVYLQGHSYEDASRMLGMPLGTLKRMQTQGLRSLRESMGV